MIQTAIQAARSAGELAYRFFKTQPKIKYKPDNSPVTRADIEAEKLIRKIISKKFPDHGIIGEELKAVNPNARYVWVIDPIDGTRSYVRGLPMWATLLALLENDKPIIGISFSPATDEFFVAQKGKGTYLNGKRTKVTKIKDIKSSFMAHGSIHYFAKIGKLDQLVKLCENTLGHRGFGDAFGYNLLTSGKVDFLIEANAAIHDLAAPSILVQEAGGKFTDFSGKFSLTSGNGVATNGLLHNQVLKILNSH
jgi:histidinol-phosphatase